LRSYRPEILAVTALFALLVPLSLAVSKAAQHDPRPGEPLMRSGDEIVACGQFFHIGTPVVLWLDPGGYDAYRVETRFTDFKNSDWEAASKLARELRSPNRYGLRKDALTPAEIDRVRGGGWDLPLLQRTIDQFVLHYDVAGTSRRCFATLHDQRCLSVHFMLDIDGTIYQTLDLKERAWHATSSNTRSVGIEIANIGAYGNVAASPLPRWYKADENGRVNLVVPGDGETGVRLKDLVLQPARNEPVEGTVQNLKLFQYDFTPRQYDALVKLTAALCRIFPRLNCDYPRDEKGAPVTHKLPDDALANYRGVLGHFHIQSEKLDPGPALQWDSVITRARKLLSQP
jgi:N-acetyl-anhydromuramyl-L-alanine amidase AmpD